MNQFDEFDELDQVELLEGAEARVAGVVVYGTPVDFSTLPDIQRHLYDLARGAGWKPLYFPDSIVASCSNCAVDIFLGPRSQQILTAYPDAMVLCFLCVADVFKDADDAALIFDSLDNPAGTERTD